MQSVKKLSSHSTILVVDHDSRDGTIDIAKQWNAKIIPEDSGLGHARQLCFDNTHTRFLIFVDSDVEILRNDFLKQAIKLLENEKVGAVVGMAIDHKFAYGLPASLLALRKNDFTGRVIPDYIDARETFFIQNRLDQLHLETRYLYGAMVHRSQFRNKKPEWEGANTRMLPSSMLKELIFTSRVILLLALNSRNKKNLAYLPIFYAKFFRGFFNPKPWLRLQRNA